MQGEDLNCMYQILESSSSHSWPPLNSVHSFFTPQICFTNPQNGAVEQRGSEKQKKQKKKSKEKATWYKGPWTKTEDRKLCRLVLHYGRGQWASIAQHMSGRIGKQCRERYHNNLFPNIKKSKVWSEEEEMMIIEGHKKFGNRWSAIAKFLPGRSENAVKNHWNSIKRRQFSTKQIARPHALHESKLLEDYIKNNFFNHRKTTPSAAGENNHLLTSFSATLDPPPTTEYYDGAEFPSFPAAATFAPPPSITITTNINDALVETDPPLSVDDYDTDGVPYFCFDGAINGSSELLVPYMDAIDEDVVPYFASETAVDGDLDFMHSGSAGIYPSPFTGDADSAASMTHFAAEAAVDEEMGYFRSIFGNNGEIIIH